MDMGWMHDTLEYFKQDPIHRKYHHSKLTFRMLYSFQENFVLPLSHDEVVHGKGSLIGKMPGDEKQRFANLRLLFAYMYAQPGKKLMFMGDEFGQVREWAHDTSLEWHVLQYATHSGLQEWVGQLNRVYRSEPALHVLDNNAAGFEWVDCNDNLTSTISLLRKSENPKRHRADRLQLHSNHRVGYRIRRPHRRLLAGVTEQRRSRIQRHGRREHGLRSCRRGAGAWASVFAKTDFAASGGAIPESRIVAPPSRRLSSQAFRSCAL